MRSAPIPWITAVCACASIAMAQDPQTRATIDQILERLEEIEDQQAETSEKVGGRAVVQAYNAIVFDLGGHVSSLFTHMEGERGSDTGHAVSLVELFIRAKLDEEWSLLATPGFYTFNGALLDNPATTGTAGDPTFTADTAAVENLFTSRLYGQWKPSDLLQVQAGVVGSPHGVANREYFIPSRAIAQANLHTRVFLQNHLYPQILNGAKASGKYLVGADDWMEYDAYFGTQSDAAGVGGVRVGYRFGALDLTVAANYGTGTRAGSQTPASNVPLLQSPFNSVVNLTRGYDFGGLDIDWRTADYSFKGEAYYSAEDGVADQRALSAQFTWWATAELGLSYRFDYYDAGGDLNVFLPTPAIADRGHSTEHVLGVAYNPHPSVRLRLDLHHNNLPNTSDTVQYANLSWSLSF